MVVRGFNLQELAYCRATGTESVRIRFPVETCSAFDDKRIPALYQMESIAWNIHSRNRGPMGFTEGSKTEISIDPPSENKPEHGPVQWPSAETK
jgi:hypothetical protein